MIRIAVDAMGGDFAPESNVLGAASALREKKDIELILVGREEQVKAILSGQDYDESRLRIVHTEEVIGTDEEPAVAIKRKKDSSLVVGMKMLRAGEADAFVSAGSTGAILISGQVVAGRIKGVKRAPLAVIIPTIAGKALLIDGGANVDCRPESLLQFAIMGSLYAEHAMKIENPRVGLINIGTEEDKGNILVREAFPLLRDCQEINFIGNVEARDVASRGADVFVCEAFAGNIVLKMLEGVSLSLFKKIKEVAMTDLRSKAGAALLKPYIKSMKAEFDASEYGGAPMLGLNGLVVKAHGNSKERQIKTAILQCVGFYENDLKDKITAAIRAQKESSKDDGMDSEGADS